jgi:HEAT repeat protein
VAWALGQSADKSAIPPLLEALQSKNPDVRVISIHSLEQLHATEALPELRALVDDNERSHFDTLTSVAEAARRAIAALEKIVQSVPLIQSGCGLHNPTVLLLKKLWRHK